MSRTASSRNYEQLPFETDHAEADLEQWLGANPGGILEDGPLLIIGRQVPTDLGKSIDLLGVDREGNVVVVELKRDRTPRDVVAQALEYAAFAAKLDAAALEGILGEYRPDEPLGLAEQHRDYSFGVRARNPVAAAERSGGSIRSHGTGVGKHRVGDRGALDANAGELRSGPRATEANRSGSGRVVDLLLVIGRWMGTPRPDAKCKAMLDNLEYAFSPFNVQ